MLLGIEPHVLGCLILTIIIKFRENIVTNSDYIS